MMQFETTSDPGFTRKNKKNGQSSWYITINIAIQPSSHATLVFFFKQFGIKQYELLQGRIKLFILSWLLQLMTMGSIEGLAQRHPCMSLSSSFILVNTFKSEA